MALTTFTMLCYHHDHFQIFHHPKQKHLPIKQYLLIPSSVPEVANLWSTFCLQEFAYSRYIIKWNHSIIVICIWLISPSLVFLRSSHVVIIHLIALIGLRICLFGSVILYRVYIYIYMPHFVSSSIDGHVDCFPLLWIMLQWTWAYTYLNSCFLFLFCVSIQEWNFWVIW